MPQIPSASRETLNELEKKKHVSDTAVSGEGRWPKGKEIATRQCTYSRCGGIGISSGNTRIIRGKILERYRGEYSNRKNPVQVHDG
jgi:hypothetical protein